MEDTEGNGVRARGEERLYLCVGPDDRDSIRLVGGGDHAWGSKRAGRTHDAERIDWGRWLSSVAMLEAWFQKLEYDSMFNKS